MKVIFLDIDGVLNTTVDNTKIHIRDRGFHFFIEVHKSNVSKLDENGNPVYKQYRNINIIKRC